MSTDTFDNASITSVAASGSNPAAVQIVGTFVNPGIATYQEAGLFDSEGNMFARTLFSTDAVLSDSEDDLVVTWDIDLGS